MDETVPDVRPLGYLALGAALLSALLSVTYFFSFFAYLAAIVAITLGVISRTDLRARRTGTISISLAVLSAIAATWILVSTN